MPQASRMPRKRRHGVTRRNIAAIGFAIQVSAAGAETSSADQIIARTHAAFRAARSASVLDSLETLCRANLSLVFLPKRDRLVAEAIELINENKFKEANDAFLRIGDLESDLSSRKKACHPSPEEALRATTPRDDVSSAPPQASAQDMSHSGLSGSPAFPADSEAAKAAIPTEAAPGSQSQDPALAVTGEGTKPAQDRDLDAPRKIASSALPRHASRAEPSAVLPERTAEEAKIDTMSPPKEASRPAPAAPVTEESPIAASSAQPAATPAPASSAATEPDRERPARGRGDPPYDFSYLPALNEPSSQGPIASTTEAPSAPPTNSTRDSGASAKRASVDAGTGLGSAFGESAPPPSPAGSATTSAPRDEAAPVQPAAPMRYDFAQIEKKGAASASPSPAQPSGDVSTRLEPAPEIAAPQKHAQVAEDRSAGSLAAPPQNSSADAPSPTFAVQEAKPPHADAAPSVPATLSGPVETAPPRATPMADEPSSRNASGKAFAQVEERSWTTGALSSMPGPAAPLYQPPEPGDAAEMPQGASALAQGAAGENAPAGFAPSQASAAPEAATGALAQANIAGKLPVEEILQQAAKEKSVAASSILSSKAPIEAPPALAAPRVAQPIEGTPVDKLALDRPPLTAGEPPPFRTKPDQPKESSVTAVPEIPEARTPASLRKAAARIARAFANISTLAATQLSHVASEAAQSLITAEIENPAEREPTRESPRPTLSLSHKGEPSIAATTKIAHPPEWSVRQRTAAAEDQISVSQRRADTSFARSDAARRPRAAPRGPRAAMAYHGLRTPSPTAALTAKLALGARAIDKPEDRHSSRPRYGRATGEKANSLPVRARVAASQGHEPSALPGMLRRHCPTILASGDEYDDELVSFCAQWANAME